ncbi:hypothetical protein [Amycolatopsis sacchari]|uniref:hypothetical protein n=1 Tax=Amycolatopsis sacchari TaxID=115433 RepID=UPI003EC0697B
MVAEAGVRQVAIGGMFNESTCGRYRRVDCSRSFLIGLQRISNQRVWNLTVIKSGKPVNILLTSGGRQLLIDLRIVKVELCGKHAY